MYEQLFILPHHARVVWVGIILGSAECGASTDPVIGASPTRTTTRLSHTSFAAMTTRRVYVSISLMRLSSVARRTIQWLRSSQRLWSNSARNWLP